MKLRKPDFVHINGQYTPANTHVDLALNNDRLDVYLTSTEKVCYVTLHWDLTSGEKRNEPVKVLGDEFERCYLNAAWRGIEPERRMPWYFAVSNGSDACLDYSGRFTECFGVEVRPSAFCTWFYGCDGIDLVLDVKNGGRPVELNGRTLKAATVLMKEYVDISAFRSLQQFCREMSPTCLKPEHVIYGSNNWYYAYGKSSAKEILSDTNLIAGLCKDCENKPFMVIDAGWECGNTDAAHIPNEDYGDMKALAEQMAQKGVIPGIWLRYLYDVRQDLHLPEGARRENHPEFLDPTHPAVQADIIDLTKKVASWGYKIIKHDFSSYDISLGVWGRQVEDYNFFPHPEGFYDRTKTTAEIIVDFYKLILDAAEGMYIIGCNTFSHLCAGLVHANRIGEDTSGYNWITTRRFGVNSLAFRLCQNGSFYVADADCVGILEDNIPWEQNRQWLDLVANSGTSLFVSCQPKKATGEIYDDLKAAYKVASLQKDELIPLDWMETATPARYLINGVEKVYNWAYSKRVPD